MVLWFYKLDKTFDMTDYECFCQALRSFNQQMFIGYYVLAPGEQQ